MLADRLLNFPFHPEDKNSGEDNKGILLYYYVSVYLRLTLTVELAVKLEIIINHYKQEKIPAHVLFVKYFQYQKVPVSDNKKIGKERK